MTMRFRQLAKRATLLLGLVAVTVIASGSAFEYFARQQAYRQFRAPGQLVNVGGGRHLQVDCRGAGAPTVVLESGLDNYGSLAWTSVQDAIAKQHRVCAYSRAGIMWSDPSRTSFDSREAMQQLHTALIGAGESAPWLMVGHSLGGAYITTFTKLYPEEVGGLVYVDASHPKQFARYRTAVGKSIAPSVTEVRIGAALAWTGVLRLLPTANQPATWPEALATAAPAFLGTSLGALARETEAIPSTLAEADAGRALGDRALVVLSAGKAQGAAELTQMGLTADQGALLFAAHLALAADMATWSTRGRLEVVAGASHYIQLDRPDVVIAAVFEVGRYVTGHDTGARRW